MMLPGLMTCIMCMHSMAGEARCEWVATVTAQCVGSSGRATVSAVRRRFSNCKRGRVGVAAVVVVTAACMHIIHVCMHLCVPLAFAHFA